MKVRLVHAVMAFALTMLTLPGQSEAAGTSIRGRFSFDGVASCSNPPMQNLPIHVEGTGVLSTDRSAQLNMSSNVEGPVQINTKLGGRPSETPGGSATLRVAGRHTLRAVRDYPNNIIVVSMTVVGNSCSMRVENRLKRGKRQYTFSTSGGFAYCSRPQITRTECTPY